MIVKNDDDYTFLVDRFENEDTVFYHGRDAFQPELI